MHHRMTHISFNFYCLLFNAELFLHWTCSAQIRNRFKHSKLVRFIRLPHF
jgi:hypothetical protein